MQNTDQPRALLRYELTLAVGWTLVIAALICVNVVHERMQTLEMARIQARSNFQRDLTYRQWNAVSGSVYVEVSDVTPPNPYLANLSERDVITTTGRKLTRVNPAYMSRLVFDLAQHSQDVRGHICSLRPIRPQNSPDPWERAALLAFERGEREISGVESVSGSEYLRLMSPLLTSQQCLQCHGEQGYRLGDVRGGITVAVPMAPFWEIYRQNVGVYLTSLVLIWLTGLIAIFKGASRLRTTIAQREAAEREVVQLNRDLVALTSELRAANADLDSFSATVSHDLRSPLTAISGYCDLLRELPPSGAETRAEFIEIIKRQARRMGQMVDTLLEFSRVTRGGLVRRPTDLSAMAEEIALGLQLTDPNRRVRLEIEPGMTAHCDPALLGVVLQNLLGNAWKYTGEREEAVIEFATTARGSETVYLVRDNGIGFDRPGSEKIFNPFSRLENSNGFEGSGIGLATVKRIVTRHGGSIWCEGDLGQGATFFFTLPCGTNAW